MTMRSRHLWHHLSQAVNRAEYINDTMGILHEPSLESLNIIYTRSFTRKQAPPHKLKDCSSIHHCRRAHNFNSMWLLSTKPEHLKLQYFGGPEEVSGGYAILSHVWIGQEQTFQDLRGLIAEGAQLDHPKVSSKIRGACNVANAHGYSWVWIDTCCIDKTSSAELSEAINSMFQWYALSGVCYAYLHDVPSGNGLLDAAYSPFRLSRWFTRGWTLQELIAPRFLMFMSNDWVPLGTKASLSDVVESITGVDAAVLTFSRDIADVSVARRMSWASSRHTTRVEDEAYCLMGLFGVNMSTLYGEGRDAFRRLQEEIMKRTSDHTLFAWGGILPERNIPGKLVPDALEAANFLFAPSPAAFVGSANMVSISPEKAIKAAAEYLSVLPSGVRVSLTCLSGKAQP